MPTFARSWGARPFLEVDVLGADRLEQVVGVGAGLVVAALGEPAREARGQAARQDDQALTVRRQLGEVDRRLAAVEALEEPGRAQPHEVAVALIGGRHEGQVVALGLLRAAVRVVVDVVDLAADDRLDPVLLGRLVELDGAVHHTMVGQRERRLPEGRGALGERVDLARPVEQRVLGVDVQVGAGRG